MHDGLESVLDQYVRPLLHAHGGDLEVLSVEDGVLRFRMTGQCAGCPAADLTTEELIWGEVTARVPGIRQVALERETSGELLDQARAILRARHDG